MIFSTPRIWPLQIFSTPWESCFKLDLLGFAVQDVAWPRSPCARCRLSLLWRLFQGCTHWTGFQTMMIFMIPMMMVAAVDYRWFGDSLTEQQSVTSRSREFPFPGIVHFLLWYRNRYRKNLVPKKVSEPVSKTFWYRKKSRNRSRKNLVPKKVSESVSEKNWYRKKSRNRSRKYLVSVSKLPGLKTFPLDLLKQY